MSKKNKTGIVLGIDLGTTNSVMAILEADGTPTIVPNADGHSLTPSIVNLSDEKHPVVGVAAFNQSAFAPGETASLFKRVMGRLDASGQTIPAFVHPKSGKAYSPEELSSCVIRYLVESAEAALGTKVFGVVISVPAYFEDAARKATRRAGELAGVNVLRIVNEPTAAGLAFGLDGGDDGTYAIYDLGGGTFDISILKIQKSNFDVLASDGDRDCGGSDFDNLVVGDVAAAFKATHGIEITPDSDLVTWREILEKSETAKKTLSQSEIASFMISAEGQRIQFDLKRSHFNSLIAPIIENTKTITQRALDAAKLGPKDVDDTILVGGSTRIPAVRQMLADIFGKEPRTDVNPDEAVTAGAAIYAARLATDSGLSVVDTQGHKVLPPPISVTDVTSHPLGCCLALVDGVMRNCVIIPANTPLPAEKEDRFSLVDNNQTAAKVTISTGADRALPEDCTIHGDLTLSGLPTRPTGEDTIVVKYRFTVEGTLEVTITDEVSGKCASELKRGFDGFATGNSQS